ncbi:MAG: MoxR family ATPase [Burkholderiaceae bacterium]|nr:MoxR family ATPase [Burkholderiaceae bacterium]
MNAPDSIDSTAALLAEQDYVADRQLATAVFLALKLKRPLFLEGEPCSSKASPAPARPRSPRCCRPGSAPS